MGRFKADGNNFFIEADGQIMEVLELGAETLEFDFELVETFISLFGTCFKLGAVLIFNFVKLGLELFVEVLYVMVVLLALGLDDVFDDFFILSACLEIFNDSFRLSLISVS